MCKWKQLLKTLWCKRLYDSTSENVCNWFSQTSTVTEGAIEKNLLTTIAPTGGNELVTKAPKEKEKENILPIEVDEENEIGINEKEHPGKEKINVLRSSAIIIQINIEELRRKVIKVSRTVDFD